MILNKIKLAFKHLLPNKKVLLNKKISMKDSKNYKIFYKV